MSAEGEGPRRGRRGRRAGRPPAGRAIGWWIAGFEERIYPERETVEERVRWGSEVRVASGEDAGVVVRFPDEAPVAPAPEVPVAPAPGPAMKPALRIGSIVLRVDDLDREAAFWTAALDYVRRPDDPDDFALLHPRDGAGPNLSLDLHRASGRVPPRIHLDLYAADQAAEVARLLALGASEVHWDGRPPDADYVILADPEGNRFCVVDASGGPDGTA